MVDGTGISYTSLSEKNPGGILSLYDVRLHVLGEGDKYDLVKREPVIPKDGNKE